MTKVTIISGFLGAGKTTFIRKLLEELYKGQNIVLIENEYGEIGIDGSFLKDAGIQISEMNSGCICCTLVGDFTKALKQVIDRYNPDRIIIEPSGVGKLSDIAAAVERVKDEVPELEITEKIAVVDAKKARIYIKNFGEFFKDQVHHASTIVLSRTQDVSAEKLAEAVALLRSENADAPMITTPWDALSADAIRHALEHSDVSSLIEEAHEHHHHHHHEDGEECCCGHHHDEEEHEHHHHHHEDGEECCCGHHHDEEEHEHHHHHHEDGEECCCGHHHDEEEHEHHHHHHEDGEECSCGCGHHHHHHADEVFTSWGRETAHKYSEEEVAEILEELAEGAGYGTILRAKGILAMADGSWKQFDLVPEESQVRPSAPDYTSRLCVIGCQLREDELTKLFRL